MDENKEMDELFEEETPVESAAEENTEPETEEVDDGDETDGEGDEPAAEGDGEGTPENKDTGKDDLARIKADLAEMKASRDAEKKAADARVSALLKSMGYTDEDTYWAEKKGLTPEQYKKQKSDEAAVAQAHQIVAQQKYAKMAAEDLAALKDAGLIGSDVDHIGKIDNARRFAELREKGLSPVEAYRAVNGAKLDERAAQAARSHAGGKDHLTPHRSRPGANKGSVMSAAEREMFKSLLHTDDDKAVEAAWKRAHSQ